jgi:hypothetical protein
MKITRSSGEPDRELMDWAARWEGVDRGIIASWERGREKRKEDLSLSNRAQAGELPVLPWKGGVDKAIKGGKYGTFLYLAMWQGLRGDALEVNMAEDVVLVCTRTGVQVTYTADQSKYRNVV